MPQVIGLKSQIWSTCDKYIEKGHDKSVIIKLDYIFKKKSKEKSIIDQHN